MRPPRAWPKEGKEGLQPLGPEALKAVEYIRAGNYIHIALMAAGVGKETWHKWRKLAAIESPETEPHRELQRRIDQAMAESEVGRIERIGNAALLDWKADAWLSERRSQKRWGRRLETKNETTTREVKLPEDTSVLEPAEMRGYLLAMAKMAKTEAQRKEFLDAAAALEGATR